MGRPRGRFGAPSAWQRIALGVIALTSALSASGCGSSELPPLGEVLVVVDTDLDVPLLAGRLRVDLYSESGTWYESRDVGRPQPQDWPASFSIYAPDETRDTRVLVRLRVYPEGTTRDYRGERYAAPGLAPEDLPLSDELGPRLVRNGVDVTPPTEPEPTSAVDRIVLLRLKPGVRGRASVFLSGACVGTMPLLSTDPPFQTPSVDGAASCTDVEGEITLVRELRVVEGDMTVPPREPRPPFGEGEPCPPETGQPDDRRSHAACIRGGAFLLGSAIVSGIASYADTIPERTTVVSTFWLDRYEVTVADYRRARARGFKGLAIAHDAPLGETLETDAYELDRFCTYTTDPGDREDHPLNCVDWAFGRAYCKFHGGDLPTEAQWEYAATKADRTFETPYAWGNESPDCERIVTENVAYATDTRQCDRFGAGPKPVHAWAADVSPSGVFGLGGNVAEIVRDTLHPYDAPCWRFGPVVDPLCEDPAPRPMHALRGSSFLMTAAFAHGSARNDDETRSARSVFGFRCAYPSRPPEDP